MVHYYTTATVAIAAFMSTASALTVNFKNNCPNDVKLVMREGGNFKETSWPLAPQATTSKSFGKGFEGHFRLGDDDAATLVEFSTKGDMNFVWYDISVIPPQLNPGFEFCSSHEECIANSKSKKGYNTAVQMTPTKNTNGNQCRELTCQDPKCPDAYLFPKDDTKTHACPLETDFTVTFCLGGSGGNQGPAPAPAPEPTTVAPTTAAPQPTTAAPEGTPSPTTTAPQPTASAPIETPKATTSAPTTAPTVAPTEAPQPATVAPTIAPAVTPMPTPAPQPPTTTPVVYPVPAPTSNGNANQNQAPSPTSAPSAPQPVLGDERATVSPPRDHCV